MILKEAMAGWQAFMMAGKYPLLVLGMLLGLWIYRGACKGRTEFYSLAFVTVVLAVCPPTAAILMKYQTGFYAYVWIWSLVPMTAFIALCLSDFLPGMFSRFAGKQRIALGILIVMVLWMCGRMDWQLPAEVAALPDRESMAVEKRLVEDLVEAHESPLLWAPKETMDYARELSARINLVYGRDMWDASLGAYTYEIYDSHKQELYEWMNLVELIDSRAGTIEEHADTRNPEEMSRARACGVAAAGYGVNEILLPDNTLPSWRQALLDGLSESGKSWQETSLEGYWRYYVQE